jgi:hypothetical protein
MLSPDDCMSENQNVEKTVWRERHSRLVHPRLILSPRVESSPFRTKSGSAKKAHVRVVLRNDADFVCPLNKRGGVSMDLTVGIFNAFKKVLL